VLEEKYGLDEDFELVEPGDGGFTHFFILCTICYIPTRHFSNPLIYILDLETAIKSVSDAEQPTDTHLVSPTAHSQLSTDNNLHIS